MSTALRLSLALALPIAVTASGCAAGWQLIGDSDVPFRLESETIQTRMDARFRHIVLEVGDNDIELLDLHVELGDGEPVDFPVRTRIAAGTRTRVLDLPGGARLVRDVTLTYRTDGRPTTGRAHVFIYGQ